MVVIPPVDNRRLNSKMALLTTEVAGVRQLDIVRIYQPEPSWRDYVQMQLCGIHWDWLTICSCRLPPALPYCSGSCRQFSEQLCGLRPQPWRSQGSDFFTVVYNYLNRHGRRGETEEEGSTFIWIQHGRGNTHILSAHHSMAVDDRDGC